MKCTILTCVLFLSSFQVSIGQNFTVTPTNHLIENAALEIYSTYQIDMLKDEGVESLQLIWKLLEITYPEDWTVNLCDFGTCYATIPNNGVMDLITGEDFGYLKLDINPHLTHGTGIARFVVYEVDHFEDAEEVIFEITAGTVSNVELTSYKYKVFPNPAQSELFIENPELNLENVNLFSPLGKLIFSNIISNEPTIPINLNGLNPGIYHLQLINAKDEVSTHKIIIQ